MAYTTGIRLELCWITAFGTILVASMVAAQNATLLSTIPNPTPAAKDYFGCAVVALGADRVLAGAYGEDPAMEWTVKLVETLWLSHCRFRVVGLVK